MQKEPVFLVKIGPKMGPGSRRQCTNNPIGPLGGGRSAALRTSFQFFDRKMRAHMLGRYVRDLPIIAKLAATVPALRHLSGRSIFFPI